MRNQFPDMQKHTPFTHYEYAKIIAETKRRRDAKGAYININGDTQLITISDLLGPRELPEAFRFQYANMLFDCLFVKKEATEKLYVIFSGLKMEIGPFPFFNRLGWASHLDGATLYISDPIFSLYPALAIGWYLGTPEMNMYPVLATIAQTVSRKCGAKRIIAYGSSGGGFAAFKLAEWLPLSAIAINPQIFLPEFHYFPEFCKKTGFTTAPDWEQRSRINLAKHSTYLLIQNDTDAHHCQKHAYPFLKEAGIFPKYGLTGYGNFYYWQYHAIGGHKYAENSNILPLIISILDSLPVTDSAALDELDNIAISISELWAAIAWFDHQLEHK